MFYAALPFYALAIFMYLCIPFGRVEIAGEVLRGFIPNLKAKVELFLFANFLFALGDYVGGM